MEQWIAIVIAVLGGGTISTIITTWANRRTRAVEGDVRQTESAVAGLAILVGALQEERAVCRDELKDVRHEVDLLRVRLKVVENGQ